MTELQIAEKTGRYIRSLRRFKFTKNEDADVCPLHGYHNASVAIEETTEPSEEHGDNWPHDDERWPTACGCGYVFEADDQWQRNDDAIYRRTDGREFVWGSGAFGKSGTKAAMQIRNPPHPRSIRRSGVYGLGRNPTNSPRWKHQTRAFDADDEQAVSNY